MKFECKICNSIFYSKKGFTSHITKIHNITCKRYYDCFIKTENEDKCPVCLNTLRFISIYKGYIKYCAGCILKTGIPQKKLRGSKKSEKHKKNLSESIKRVWRDNKSVYHTKKYKRKHAIITKCRWNDKNSIYNTKEYRNKLSESVTGNKNGMFNKKHNQKTKILMSDKHRPDLNQYIEKYPTFCKIEAPIKNLNENEYIKIQVKCKFCKQYFTPSRSQLQSRIYAVEKLNGNDGLYLYCSKECKTFCPLYKVNPNHEINKNNIKEPYYTREEYYIFREYVLQRDNHLCQYCNELAEHVHHERPQKLEPFFALDPDLAWSVCKKCHYEKGHTDECSSVNLANKICKKELGRI